VVAVTAGLCLAANAFATLEREADFDIPAADLSRALLQLGQQARISIVFSKGATERVRSPELRGSLSVAEALRRLLGDACLTPVEVANGLIAIRVQCRNPPRSGTEIDELQTLGPVTPPPGVEEVIVRERHITGSRIRSPRPDASPQIDIIDRSDIELAGNQDIGELLRLLPAVAGNATSTLVTNGGDGTANVTLRGLPSSNTLVLLNGRRVNPDPWLGRSVDLNTLPLALVERIEVLKDGASTLYGSDAIAGVVNIVTRRDFEGLQLSSYYGASSRGDLTTSNSSVLYGGHGSNTDLTVGASYYEQDPIFSRDRSLSRSSDDRSRGGTDKRSSATPSARITLPSGPVILAEPSLPGTDPADFRPATSEDLFEYRTYTTTAVPSTRWSVFGDARRRVGTRAQAYLETLFTRTRSENTSAPTPIFTAFELLPLTVSAGNRYNPFGIDLTDVRRRVVELGPRANRFESDSTRMVLGVEGEEGSAHWDLAYAYHRTTADEGREDLLSASALARALGPDAACPSPCIPVNVFGPPGSISPEMLAYVRLDAESRGRSNLEGVSFNIDFPLARVPAGTVEIASGVEYRSESLRVDPDPSITASDTIGGTNEEPTSGSRHLWEAFAEAEIPLVVGRPWAKRLDLQVASRFSQYSDFGRSVTPKLGLRYRPTETLLVQAGVATGFRAPTLRQLHAGPAQSFQFLNDPCALPDSVGVLPGCLQPSDPTLVQFMTLLEGDADLDAEQAETYTLGLGYRPDRWPGLSASVDYFHIRTSDVVDSSAQFVVNENARTMAYADRVVRDSSGNIVQVIAPYQNLGQRDVTGFDFDIAWTIPVVDAGSVDVALEATHLRSFDQEYTPEGGQIDQAGTFTDEASAGNGALPDWKVNLGLIWKTMHWNAAYHVRFVSRLTEVVPILGERRTIDSWQSHKLQISYLGPATFWTKLTLGINNLFDAEPPFAAAAFNDSYDSRTYDITGRYAYLVLQKDL